MVEPTTILIVGLVLNIVITLVGGMWKLSRVEVSIRATIADHRAEIDAGVNAVQRNVGESLHAIRLKIHDVEMYGRDHYVLKPDYQDGVRALSQSLQILGDKIETRLLRMENKMDATKH